MNGTSTVRPATTDSPSLDTKPFRFKCSECGTDFAFGQHDDPTSSHGACRTCGSHRYTITDRSNGQPVG